MYKALIILLVDDDVDDREIFIEVASSLGPSITIVTAINGQDALQVLDNMPSLPDFIFLDLNMGRMNGKQCLALLKQHEKFSRIPVVIYTTSKMVEEQQETSRLGSVYFLTKPTSMRELEKEIKFVLNKEYEKTAHSK